MLSKIVWGFASKYGTAMAALAAAAAVVAFMLDNDLALGVPRSTLLWIAAALAVTVTVGRWAQVQWGQRPVGVGWRTWLVFAVNVAASLMLVLGDLVDEAITLGVSQETWAQMIAALSAALVIARQLTSAFGDRSS